MRLIIIRHGETLYNIDHRLTGQDETPLSVTGEQQALAVGNYLATESLDCIVSSDLQRAYKTAQAIAQHHGLSVEKDPLLREHSLGVWQGKTMTEVQASDPETYRLWREDPLQYAPGGGETLAQFRDRIAQAFQYWFERYPDGTVVWVAHAGVVGTTICLLLEIDPTRRWQFHHDNASVTELRIAQSRASLVRLNETAFLYTHSHIPHPSQR